MPSTASGEVPGAVPGKCSGVGADLSSHRKYESCECCRLWQQVNS